MDLNAPLPFDLQLSVWGAAWAGDVNEVSAALAEHRPGQYEPERTCDHDRRWIRQQRRSVGYEPYEPVPDHWALPWVTEARVRGWLP